MTILLFIQVSIYFTLDQDQENNHQKSKATYCYEKDESKVQNVEVDDQMDELDKLEKLRKTDFYNDQIIINRTAPKDELKQNQNFKKAHQKILLQNNQKQPNPPSNLKPKQSTDKQAKNQKQQNNPAKSATQKQIKKPESQNSLILRQEQIKNENQSQKPNEKSSVTIQGGQFQEQLKKDDKLYDMPLEIDRNSVLYNHLTWKWGGNKNQLLITRFKGTKHHWIPAFLDFTIPPRGRHLLKMQVVRSVDYRIYFGITVKSAIYQLWSNAIPAPFIVFSFQKCCVIQKPHKQNTTMKQIIPKFSKVYNHIEMQVDMQKLQITFYLKKSRKYSITHAITKNFVKQTMESEQETNVKKKVHGLIPFVAFTTNLDQVKFLAN